MLNLVALRALRGTDAAGTKRLQRYILGLAMVAFACEQDGFLREGCLLVPKDEKPSEIRVVGRTGKREAISLDTSDIVAYAQTAAGDFGVGENWTATFNRETARASMEKRGEKKGIKAKGKP